MVTCFRYVTITTRLHAWNVSHACYHAWLRCRYSDAMSVKGNHMLKEIVCFAYLFLLESRLNRQSSIEWYGVKLKLRPQLQKREKGRQYFDDFFSIISYFILILQLIRIMLFMYQSNRSFDIPPPGHTPGIWRLFLPGREGIWSPLIRGGEFDR